MTSLPPVVVIADDPDAYIERAVTSATGADLTFAIEVASGDGPYSLTGTWQGAVGPTRTLRVPVALLGVGAHHLYLRVPGDNDFELGWVRVVERFPGTTDPIAPITADSIITALLADGGSAFRVALNTLLGSGSDLMVVNGGTITLDDGAAEGTLLAYRVKANTTFTAASGTVDLAAGAYSIERTATGWTYYTIPTGTPITPPITWATAAADTFVGDGALVGRTTTTGGLVWNSGTVGSVLLVTTGGNLSRTYDGNGANWESKANLVLATAPDSLRFTVTGYSYSAGAGFDLIFTYLESGSTARTAIIGINPTLAVNDPGGAPLVLSGDTTGWPASGNVTLTIEGSVLTISNGTLTATGVLGGGGATVPNTLVGINLAGSGTQTVAGVLLETQ